MGIMLKNKGKFFVSHQNIGLLEYILRYLIKFKKVENHSILEK